MQDTLKMKRSISEYDKDGNLVFSKTEYFPDCNDQDDVAADIEISVRTEPDCDGVCEQCEDEDESVILDDLIEHLDKTIFKLRVLRAVRNAARCAVGAAAAFAVATVFARLYGDKS